ncbi:hypothetical protein [Dactylosporangium sp. NPDC051541]|uniref:hypothetical protein n=1 Tax=Dactylosporangium sp. NPDC051541 TaxID=3363977 RepID=UPI0037AA034A
MGTAYCSIEFNADQACGISKLLWNTARRYNGLLRGGSQSLNNAYEPVTGYLTGIAIELATYCQNKTGQDPLPGRR